MTKTDRDNLLDLLLRESAQARDDDRYMDNQFPTLITVALALMVAMAGLYTNTYAKGHPPPNLPPGSNLVAVPVWVYAGAPLLPIVLISYAVLISTLGTLRSYYMRAIERKIHYVTSQGTEEFPIPSWAHVQLEVTGQTHSGRWARFSWPLIYGIISLMVVGCIYLALVNIPDIRYQVFALTVDGALMAIPISAGVLSATRGSRLWEGALIGLRERLRRTDANFPSQQPPSERSLGSYLLLPRNQEELLKALFIPICLVIGRWLAPRIPPWTWDLQNWDESRSSFWHFVGFFLVFEFLIYQARYLLNDVRDRNVDCGKKLPKQRFPCSWLDGGKKEEFAFRAAFVSFLARWATAGLVVGCVLPYKNSMWIWHAGFLLTVFLIALPYEAVRSKCDDAKPRSRWAWTLAVVTVVGLGYGLRSVVGLWLAGVDDKVALVLVALGASLFGSTFVALTWALESTRERRKGLAAGKAHLVCFRTGVVLAARRSRITVGPTQRVLVGRQSLMAPWCAPAVLATAVLFAFVLYLLRVHVSVSQCVLIAVGVIGIAGAAAVTRVKTAFCLTGLNVIFVGVVLACLSAAIGRSVIAALVTALPLTVTCIFRTMCFEDLPGFTTKLGKIVGAGWTLSISWFKKERKGKALAPSSTSPPLGGA